MQHRELYHMSHAATAHSTQHRAAQRTGVPKALSQPAAYLLLGGGLLGGGLQQAHSSVRLAEIMHAAQM